METAIEQKLIGGKSFFLFDFHIDLSRSKDLIYQQIFSLCLRIYMPYYLYVLHRLSSWSNFQFAAIKLIA